MYMQYFLLGKSLPVALADTPPQRCCVAAQRRGSFDTDQEKYSGPSVRFKSKGGVDTLEFHHMGVPFCANAAQAAPEPAEKSICVITGLPAKYRHKVTLEPYANAAAYKALLGRHKAEAEAAAAAAAAEVAEAEAAAAAAATRDAHMEPGPVAPMQIDSRLPTVINPQLQQAQGAQRPMQQQQQQGMQRPMQQQQQGMQRPMPQQAQGMQQQQQQGMQRPQPQQAQGLQQQHQGMQRLMPQQAQGVQRPQLQQAQGMQRPQLQQAQAQQAQQAPGMQLPIPQLLQRPPPGANLQALYGPSSAAAMLGSSSAVGWGATVHPAGRMLGPQGLGPQNGNTVMGHMLPALGKAGLPPPLLGSVPQPNNPPHTTS